MGRPPCCDKSNVKRGLWTPEEDAKILAYVSNHGTGNWTLVPKKAGLNRCGKSCRLRWTNYLRPDLKHDGFTPQEEMLIINLHAAIGSRWSLIARRLPGRTDNDVKNYWNTKLRKKLMKMGIDPVTHKPVSQVLSDLGSISTFPNTNNNQMSFVNNDLMKNMLPTRTEPYGSQYSSITTNASAKKNTKVDQIHSLEHQYHVFSEASSSNSSSTSSNIERLSSTQSYSCQNPQAQITTPCSSFEWSEFLHSDPFIWSEFQQLQQCDMQMVMSPLKPSSLMQSEVVISNNNGQVGASEGSVAVTCDPSMSYQMKKQCENHSSFVDGILDKDSEIREAFPNILDAAFDY
ncbi:hypothetical protein Lal_00005920 [Lupinus albus]|uniref:Putative transcription factor MYB-HB-like family n=1 Tax=Lupinus albus TaxID=3870 RepID=A0A6A5MX96_LUPAL|nr:putative transcription factor MYB-HB-like family [Lupinus albus]KAF1879454.1 hypothetical protein Lal_00005920 [Lupinus albus]